MATVTATIAPNGVAKVKPVREVPAGTDAAANAELAKAWKEMENRVQELAKMSHGKDYDPNLQPSDVMANLDAIQNPKKKSYISPGVKEAFNNTLTAVSKVGGMIADAASQVFAPAGQCYNALNFVISAWQGYQEVFGELSSLFGRCGEFLDRLHHYVAGKMNAKLTDVACQVLQLFVSVCDHAMKIRHSGRFKFKTFMKIAFFNQDDFKGLIGEMDSLTDKEQLLVLAQTYEKASKAAEYSKNTMGLLSEDRMERSEQKKALNDRSQILKTLNFDNTPDTWDSNAQAPIATWVTTYQNIRQNNVEGTGQWLLSDQSFQTWMSPMTDTPVLALVGPEAAGKSYLASTVINHLRTQVTAQVETSRRLVGFHFLDERKANAGIAVLGKSIIWQFADGDASYMQSAAGTCRKAGTIDPTRLMPRLLLENHDELENVDVTFFIVINKLGDKKGHVHPAVVKFLQQALRCKRRAVRVLFTTTQDTIDRLERDQFTCPAIQIQKRNADDAMKYIDARMDRIDSLSDTRQDGIAELRRDIQDRLYKATKGNYYMMDKTLTKISSLDYDKDIYNALDGAGRSLEDHIVDDVRRLNETLSAKEIEEMNKIILWTSFAQERVTADIMSAVLRFKNDAVSLTPLGERLKKKFLLFEIDNDGYVAFRSEKILDAIPERAAAAKERQRENPAVNEGEVEILRHFLKSVCPPGLAEKLEMEQHFREKLSARQQQIYREDENNAHFQLAKVCLHALANKAGEKLRPLRGYASRQLVYHISQVDLAEIDPELKGQIGPDLVNLFRDRDSIDNLLWATKAVPTFPSWLLEKSQMAKICDWLSRERIVANVNEEGRKWLANLFGTTESHRFNTIILPCARRMAELCLKEESPAPVATIAFYCLDDYFVKTGALSEVDFKHRASTTRISEVEGLIRSENLVSNPDALWETQMGYVYDGFSQFSKAEERCRNALKDAPKGDKAPWRPLLLLAKVVQSHTESIEILKQLMERCENDSAWMAANEKSYAEMAFILGNRYWSTDRSEKSGKIYSQCLQHDPTNTNFFKAILARYQDTERWEDIIGFFEQMHSQSQLAPMALSLADEERLHVIILLVAINTKKYYIFDHFYPKAIAMATKNRDHNAAFYLRESYAGALAVLPELPLEKVTELLETAAMEDIPNTTLNPTVAFFLIGYRLGRIYLDKAIEAKNAGRPEKAIETLRMMQKVVPEQVNEDQMRLPLRLFGARYYKQQDDLPTAYKLAHNTLRMAIELLSDEDDSNDTLAYTKILHAAIPFGDKKNALAALSMLKVGEGDQFSFRCSCKCGEAWDTPGNMWWCMDCINMVLTPECYKKVKSGEFFNNICHKNHSHFFLPEMEASRLKNLPKNHVPWGDEDILLEDWKKDLIKTYIGPLPIAHISPAPRDAAPLAPSFLAAQQHAQNDAGKVAVIDATKKESFTFTQLLEDAAALRKQILELLGLTSTGDLEERRIAFLVPNGYDYVVTQWATWAAGGVAVPLCTSHPAKELLYTIGDSDPSLILIHPAFERLAPALREGCTTDIPFLGLDPFSRNDSPSLPTFVPAFPLNRRALMIYTSGTTGNPKGGVSTHEIIEFQASSLVKAWKYSPSDHLIHVLPLHHIHGIINGLTACLLSGTTVEMHPKFDPKVIWERWQDRGSSTMFMAVPTIYSRLNDYFDANIRGTEREEAAREGAKALRLLISGSAALPTPVKTRFAEITGQILLERFGMTEIGMAISCGLELDRRVDGSVGWPLPGVQVRLTEKETGRIIEEIDQDGMIEIKGGNVFREYWRKPEATASEFTADGWFKTGDVAKRDATGAYFIQGRASVDLIKSGGYKISALEVERKMLALESIQEVAVVGLKNEEWGQQVAAVVKFREGTTPLELPELRAILKTEMAPYKVPTVLKVVDGIERNAMGKVNKKTLIQKYWPDKA